MFFCFSLCALLFFGVCSVSVSADNAEPVLIGDTWDSGALAVDKSQFAGSTSYPDTHRWKSVSLPPSGLTEDNILVGYAPGLFTDVPGVAIGMGRVSSGALRWRLGTNAGALSSTVVAWQVNLDDFNLFSGRIYEFRVEELVRAIRTSGTQAGNNFTALRETFEASLYAPDGTLMETKELMFNSFGVLSQQNIDTYGSDVLFYEFEMPQQEGCILEFSVRYVNEVPSTETLFQQQGYLNWLVFSGAGIYGLPSDEELWQDEQRGFWASIIAWFQKMWDAITGIPTAIVEGIKHLFIPEDGALQAIVDDFKAFAEGRLGFVAQIGTLVSLVITGLVNGGDDGNVVLTFPSVRLPDAFGGRALWDNVNLNLTALVASIPAMTTIYTIYKILASVLLLGLLLRFLYKTADQIMNGGGDS